MRPSEDADHVTHPGSHQLLRNREHAPFRHAGPALGTGVLEHQDVVRRNREIITLDLARHVVVILEGGARARDA